mmetsp:Transcript_12192/g.40090  ORF Transcript_12192/g.40090 Transcript_12192/m.40090 type:complete len:556 (+) Transcript_12192:41-1708(+)
MAEALAEAIDAWGAAELPVWEAALDLRTPTADANRADNARLLDELNSRLQQATHEGPPKAIAKHHDKDKLTCRERADLLFDPDSPVLELGALVGYGQEGAPVGGGAFTAIGLIAGVPTMVLAHIPTIKAGAISKWGVAKMVRAQEIAQACRLPMVQLVESAGAYLAQQAEVFHDAGGLFRNIAVRAKEGLPTVAVVFGSSTAGGAYQPGLADVTIFVRGKAHVYLGGPPLVEMATGEKVSHEELGGAEMHATKSGVADFLAESEEDGILRARESIASLCGARMHRPIAGAGSAAFRRAIGKTTVREPLYPAEDLLAIAPTDIFTPYDAREVIARIVDGSQFSEFKPMYGPKLVCCFGRVAGVPVGIIANNGVLFSEEAQKGAQFISLCNSSGSPILFLSNITGFMVGKSAERGGIIKHGSLLINAVSNSDVPAITIIVGASYGAGNYAMSGRAYKPRFLFAWPQSRCAVMGADQLSGVMELVERGGGSDEATAGKRRAKLRQQIDAEASPYYTSSRGIDDGIIDPRDTRAVVSFCLAMLRDEDIGREFSQGVSRL